jgi:peptidoglycan/xylan/chitin deacetylase (PgdA/CDA1 family)
MIDGPSAILTYHSLDVSGSVLSTSPALFRRQMGFLAASGIPVVPLDQTLSRPGSIAITFDDGFRNLFDHAIPVLQHHGFPATVFVVSDYCGRRNDWPRHGSATIPDLPLLTWEDLSALPPQVTVGAHTLDHAVLTRLAPQACRRQLRDCRDRIEQRLGRPAPWLAYPYGASSPAVRALAGQHFELAAGTKLGFLGVPPDPLDLPRIDACYLRGAFPLERLFTTAGRLNLTLRCFLREVRRTVLTFQSKV